MGHEQHSFEAVEAVVANPYPPDTDPSSVRLPAVPRLRSPEDTEENQRRYWQAHLWETLLRYRRAYADPACTERLRAGYDDVAASALALAERATSGFPLAPIDSVGCHTALKELRAGAVRLEATVGALVAAAGAPLATGPGADAHGYGGSEPGVPGTRPPAQDLFATTTPTKGFEFKLSLRGSRGTRRGRSMSRTTPEAERDA